MARHPHEVRKSSIEFLARKTAKARVESRCNQAPKEERRRKTAGAKQVASTNLASDQVFVLLSSDRHISISHYGIDAALDPIEPMADAIMEIRPTNHRN